MRSRDWVPIGLVKERRVAVLMLFGGIALLSAGAEWLVRGSAALALSLRVSSLVVGLTVVAFGTSAPELVVSIHTGLTGRPEIALGNVIGSNILNVLLILGASALIVPLTVSSQIVRFDVPIMIGASLLIPAFAWDGSINRWEGIFLVLGLVAYVVWTVREAKRHHHDVILDVRVEPFSLRRLPWNLALVMVGLLVLVIGSRLFTEAAVEIARYWKFSELVIGLTIVALGTSLPEVATSITAAVRGERDIAVGNVVGSNIFNILGVLGATCAVAPSSMVVPEQALRFDIPVMIVVAVSCLPLFWTGRRISRGEGALFLAYFVIYVAYLLLAASDNRLAETLQMMVWVFAAPLTLVTVGVSVRQNFLLVRQERSRDDEY